MLEMTHHRKNIHVEKCACQPNNGHCILTDIVGIHTWEQALWNTEECSP